MLLLRRRPGVTLTSKMEPIALKRRLRRFSPVQRGFLYCIAFCVFMTLYMVIYPLKLFSRLVQVTYPAQIQPIGIAMNFTHVNPQQDADVCPGVLEGMVKGSWKARSVSYLEKNRLLAFTARGDARHNFPINFQREDGKCGNVTHQLLKTEGAKYRALCDPLGSTPCCYEYMCRPLNELECYCEDCIDMRRDLHAEFANWVPENHLCKLQTFTPAAICRLLEGSIVHFVGDTAIRHIHTAMLMLMTGNRMKGAFKPGVAGDIVGRCSGLYMFTEACRDQVSYMMMGCGGFAQVVHKSYDSSSAGQLLKTTTLRDLFRPRTLIVLGIGNHDDFNSTTVQQEFLVPLLDELQRRNRTWPKVLWVDAHAPGWILSPEYYAETEKKRFGFNDEMEIFLDKRNVSILKTYALTEHISSFDGEHYGLGVNLVKANLVLNYINELLAKEIW